MGNIYHNPPRASAHIHNEPRRESIHRQWKIYFYCLLSLSLSLDNSIPMAHRSLWLENIFIRCDWWYIGDRVWLDAMMMHVFIFCQRARSWDIEFPIRMAQQMMWEWKRRQLEIICKVLIDDDTFRWWKERKIRKNRSMSLAWTLLELKLFRLCFMLINIISILLAATPIDPSKDFTVDGINGFSKKKKKKRRHR